MVDFLPLPSSLLACWLVAKNFLSLSLSSRIWITYGRLIIIMVIILGMSRKSSDVNRKNSNVEKEMENERYVALVVYYWSSRATSSVATARERIPDASLLRQQAALFSVKSCDVLRITITVNLILHPVSRGVLRLDLSRRPIRTFPSRSVASSSFHVHI